MAEKDQIDSVDDDEVEDIESIDSSHTVGDSASSLLAKNEARRKIQSDIEAFLAAGGQIQSIDKNVVGDPPRKPESSYGSQPI